MQETLAEAGTELLFELELISNLTQLSVDWIN